MATQQATIRVRQIHCEGCGPRIEQAVSQLEGVRLVKPDHGNVELRVVVASTLTSEAAIGPAIERAGFEVQP